MDNIELLPCPFCGGEAEARRSMVNDEVMYVVFCKNCDASSAYYMQKETAIAAWNRRAVQQLASHADLIASLARSAALMLPWEPPYAEENGIWQRPVADSAVFQPYTGDPAEPLSTE